ncbi:hypothetical protein [Streptomyces sp. WMMB 322]|uniref:hypothetical protein n=1 Tax=Streptomyces sp. WMMB 322 TaxID=1286821 RepID=UPI0006E455CA|nr:hypothetical protein [Streptomyces sp. WMMB 322]SCK07812.1 hypothetical protein H180DRAFT_00313 [Streptomyces sp. WMMB 322]
MVRNLLGMLIALVGAAAAAWSPFLTWYGGRLGRDYRVGELFTPTGITGTQAGLWTGLFLPMLVAALIALLAALLRSRLLVTLAGVVVLGFAVLWMVRQGQEAGTLTAGAGGLGEGVGYAVAGGVLMLLAALVMRGRRPTGRRRKSRGRRARVDDSSAAVSPAVPYENHDYSGLPQPGGPFEPEPGPHGAYRADEWRARGRGHDPYLDDDSTPAEEWDPWAAGRPDRPPTVRPPFIRPPEEAEPPAERPGRAPDEPADQAPQGPQQQPRGPGADGRDEQDQQDERGSEGARGLPRRRPDPRRDGTQE